MGLIDQIISVESSGNPTLKNPNSSAQGLGQFIDSTWIDMLAKHRPDLTGSRAELLALKTDPELSRQMTEAYANQNGAILSKAGLPVTPGNTYLAHFAGPQGAVNVLNADPSAPVSSVLRADAIKANPFLQKMTVADLQAWANRKMGGAQSAPVQTAQAPMVAPPQAAPVFAKQPVSGPLPAPQAGPQMAMAAPPQQQGGGSYFGQTPAGQGGAPPPIFMPPRKQIDLSKLRAALEASGNRGLLT